MESVADTPAKRRKVDNGHVPASGGYNSQDDSGDDMVRDFQDFETVETVPLPLGAAPDLAHDTYSLTAPTQHITQPTQILTPAKNGSTSTVQVAASSPTRSPSLPIRTSAPPQSLRTSMAPPGTAYRAPPGIKPPPAKKSVINVTSDDDEGPTYVRDSSSDEETDNRNNIKPSAFIMPAHMPLQNQKTSFGRKKEDSKGAERDNSTESDPVKKLQSITSKLVYNPEAVMKRPETRTPSAVVQAHDSVQSIRASHKPGAEAHMPLEFPNIAGDSKKRPGLQGSVYDSRNRDDSVRSSKIPGTAIKRSADVMATAYGGSDRPAKLQKQNGPAKAMPVMNISLDQIPDPDSRNKVLRMRNVLPHVTVAKLFTTLVAKKGREDDALDYLSMQDEIDLTNDNDVDELSSGPPVQPKPKPAAKQQIKAPRKAIQEKWAPSQATVQRKQEEPKPKPVSSPVAEEPKPRRRLVRGRKGGARTPTPEPMRNPEPIPPPKQKRAALSISSDSDEDGDSALGSDVEVDTALDNELLVFFNTCSIADLSDLAETNDGVSTLLISHRPFNNLDEVRRISNAKKPSKAKNPPKAIGEKIVDKCEDMWAGYASVDELVRTVEKLGRPLAEAMKRWGVDVFGKSESGQLEIVNVSLDGVKVTDDMKSDVRNSKVDAINDAKSNAKNSKVDAMKDSGLGTPISSKNVSADENSDSEIKKDAIRTKSSTFFPQPAMMAAGVELKDYQVVGINWLSLLFEKGLSCILADDMGLGKTCQVVAFLAHLYEKGEKGPHLIIVPASTLENWLREFSLFCPFLEVMPYYGGINERPETRLEIENNIDRINVVITTYTLAKAKDDNKFLSRLRPSVVVFDEGHYLKNSRSLVYKALMRIKAKFRLLLTGTPLQNNLQELASLLGFILPGIFHQHAENLESVFNHKATTSEDSHAMLLSNQRIERARSMMTPFILRRKKHQVLQHLPTKTRRVEHCRLNPSQQTIYDEKVTRVKEILAEREAAKADPAKKKASSKDSTHVIMELRKASLHPLLFRRHYDDSLLHDITKACLKDPQWHDSNPNLVYEDLSYMTDFEIHRMCDTNPTHLSPFTLPSSSFLDSGKVSALRALLEDYMAAGARCLIFSQFTMVLDILEAVLEVLRIAFFRLDGNTRVDERQDMIDQFYADAQIPVFLLSTRAGGAGINLACANKVVIFDSGFNPQDDVQAENRAHRVGQTRAVEVVRLVCTGTIEEGIARLGESKLALDQRVAGEEGGEARMEREGITSIEMMLIGGQGKRQEEEQS